MPELPEVETLKRQLEKTIVGKKINQVEILRTKSFQGKKQKLIGQTVKKIERRAKLLQIKFAEEFPQLLIHLKLTGQLIYPKKDRVKELPGKHTRVIIIFSDKSKLYFNDLRVFGWLRVIENKASLDDALKGVKGIEPLTKEFTPGNLEAQLKRTAQPIKIALLDQNLIAGVGNIYANDALWEAKIHPQTTAKILIDEEIELLHKAVEKVIRLGIKYGGASENTYRHLSGKAGEYQNHFLVYQREGEKCRRCGEEIKRIRLGGRGTFFCPKCQPERWGKFV